MASVSKPPGRRIPPPCWSDDETVALIQVYRDKWYSLRRGNLRATDWQEVAEAVAARCTLANPPKTSIQCRHKMEKLRKRYRAEIQRIGNTRTGHRVPSSWIHFKFMDSMELGTSSSDPFVNQSNEDDDDEADEIEDQLMYTQQNDFDFDFPLNRRYPGSIAGNGTGVRIKIPMNMSKRSIDDLPPIMNPRYGSGKGYGNGMKRKDNDDDGNVLVEMVAAVQKLGDGFVKMEKMKMDMARELETVRMKTEIEQTEMVLETLQKMMDSFAESVVEKKNKKMKRMLKQ